MTIYALRTEADFDMLVSLQAGVGRFGWSYDPSSDLTVLSNVVQTQGFAALTVDQKDCYQAFLLDFVADDYVVYINVPVRGQCTAARVTGPYYWNFADPDFNHRFPVDPASICVFGRNDAIVHPALSARLKLLGRYWRIYAVQEFQAVLDACAQGIPAAPRRPQHNLEFLDGTVAPLLLQITQQIHHTHPNRSLEQFMAAVLRNMPGVKKVTWQGGAGDHGADIIAVFESGPPITGLLSEFVLVVQVKSFEQEHWDTQAIDDISRAFAHYPEASAGLIVSTADSATDSFLTDLETLREKSGKPVSLIIGPAVAEIYLKYGVKFDEQ